jgi:hypothetical protein
MRLTGGTFRFRVPSSSTCFPVLGPSTGLPQGLIKEPGAVRRASAARLESFLNHVNGRSSKFETNVLLIAPFSGLYSRLFFFGYVPAFSESLIQGKRMQDVQHAQS